MRLFLLHPIDQRIIQWRNIAVLLRRQAFQPGLAGMHAEAGATRIRQGIKRAAALAAGGKEAAR